MTRCCPEHRDWATLAEHLLDDFTDVPASAIIRELWRARQAAELFSLELGDALDCAELMVRQCAVSATGRIPFSPSTARPPLTLVHVA
jgi:hypothetical protein